MSEYGVYCLVGGVVSVTATMIIAVAIITVRALGVCRPDDVPAVLREASRLIRALGVILPTARARVLEDESPPASQRDGGR
jgi:hypothetical protein